jgi:hypothetical protein
MKKKYIYLVKISFSDNEDQEHEILADNTEELLDKITEICNHDFDDYKIIDQRPNEPVYEQDY